MTNFFAITVANLATVAKYLPYLYCLNEKGPVSQTGPGITMTFYWSFNMRITLKWSNTILVIDLTQTVALSFLAMTVLAVPMT